MINIDDMGNDKINVEPFTEIDGVKICLHEMATSTCGFNAIFLMDEF